MHCDIIAVVGKGQNVNMAEREGKDDNYNNNSGIQNIEEDGRWTQNDLLKKN